MTVMIFDDQNQNRSNTQIKHGIIAIIKMKQNKIATPSKTSIAYDKSAALICRIESWNT